MCKSHTKKIGALKLSQQDVGKNCIFRGCDNNLDLPIESGSCVGKDRHSNSSNQIPPQLILELKNKKNEKERSQKEEQKDDCRWLPIDGEPSVFGWL